MMSFPKMGKAMYGLNRGEETNRKGEIKDRRGLTNISIYWMIQKECL